MQIKVQPLHHFTYAWTSLVESSQVLLHFVQSSTSQFIPIYPIQDRRNLAIPLPAPFVHLVAWICETGGVQLCPYGEQGKSMMIKPAISPMGKALKTRSNSAFARLAQGAPGAPDGPRG